MAISIVYVSQKAVAVFDIYITTFLLFLKKSTVALHKLNLAVKAGALHSVPLCEIDYKCRLSKSLNSSIDTGYSHDNWHLWPLV